MMRRQVYLCLKHQPVDHTSHTKIDVTPNSLIRTSIATFHNFLNTDNTILVKEVIQKLKINFVIIVIFSETSTVEGRSNI
ncbi:unnamed protein product [Brugia timori]|uniref:THAP-type domain-containing protein n=1 Tax=Brugia timori TaxID=42155 RepID=A0A0R3Q5Z6_9BILA|nr:unnamed protein product [Brugia timori]